MEEIAINLEHLANSRKNINTGEWVTAIRRGEGLDLAIMYKK